jgi:hypothetical protein
MVDTINMLRPVRPDARGRLYTVGRGCRRRGADHAAYPCEVCACDTLRSTLDSAAPQATVHVGLSRLDSPFDSLSPSRLCRAVTGVCAYGSLMNVNVSEPCLYELRHRYLHGFSCKIYILTKRTRNPNMILIGLLEIWRDLIDCTPISPVSE